MPERGAAAEAAEEEEEEEEERRQGQRSRRRRRRRKRRSGGEQRGTEDKERDGCHSMRERIHVVAKQHVRVCLPTYTA